MKQRVILSLNGREQKGITLLALVVTIVVIIILAGVTITSLVGDNGIVSIAKNTKQTETNRVAEQESALGGLKQQYENLTKKPETSTWTYNQDEQTVTDGKITVKIGDYVNYDHKTGATISSYTSKQAKNGYGDQTFNVADYNYGWRVLGVNDYGQLLLITEDLVPLSGGYEETTSGRMFFYLGNTSDVTLGREAYVNGVSELNNICSIYGQGTGAIEARSVTVEDINKITGYNPESAGFGKLEATPNQYGNEVTYTLTGGKVYYQGTKYPTTSTSSIYSSFTYYDEENGWVSLETGESAKLIQEYYYYYPYSLTTDTSTSGTLAGISTDSTAYKMLFTNSSTGNYPSASGTTSNYEYWLADTYVIHGNENYFGRADWGVRRVKAGYVRGYSICGSNGNCYREYLGVRPVITLASNIQLVDSKTTRDGCTLYNMD